MGRHLSSWDLTWKAWMRVSRKTIFHCYSGFFLNPDAVQMPNFPSDLPFSVSYLRLEYHTAFHRQTGCRLPWKLCLRKSIVLVQEIKEENLTTDKSQVKEWDWLTRITERSWLAQCLRVSPENCLWLLAAVLIASPSWHYDIGNSYTSWRNTAQ